MGHVPCKCGYSCIVASMVLCTYRTTEKGSWLRRGKDEVNAKVEVCTLTASEVSERRV